MLPVGGGSAEHADAVLQDSTGRPRSGRTYARPRDGRDGGLHRLVDPAPDPAVIGLVSK